MRARVVKGCTMYYGEVYLDNKWKKVTPKCFTQVGVELELRKWKKKNLPRELEI